MIEVASAAREPSAVESFRRSAVTSLAAVIAFLAAAASLVAVVASWVTATAS